LKRKQWLESKVRRTRSWQSDPEFDNLLANTSVSGLKFLETNYKKKLQRFPKTHDMTNPENKSKYRELEVKYNMIQEERFARIMDLQASSKYIDEEYWDSTTGIVYDNTGHAKYAIYFIEDDEFDDEEEVVVEKKTRKEIYKDWNYYES